MNPALRSLLELAAAASDKEIPEDVSVEELYPELVAPLMRYEQLFARRIAQVINEHTAGLTKSDMLKAQDSYSKAYLIALDIPYTGIQALCKELIRLCKNFGLSAPQEWVDFADGMFDWEKDIADMSVE